MPKLKTKWEDRIGEVVGLYKIIKPLYDKLHVKNTKLWCECMICGERVERFSTRLAAKHTGCKPNDKVADFHEALETQEKRKTEKPTTKLAEDVPEEYIEPFTVNLPAEARNYFKFDIDATAIEILKEAEKMGKNKNYIFITTFERFVNLLHLARRLAHEINKPTLEYMVEGQRGNMITNPLITQYKQISAESNGVARLLVAILNDEKQQEREDDDPLTKALRGEA